MYNISEDKHTHVKDKPCVACKANRKDILPPGSRVRIAQTECGTKIIYCFKLRGSVSPVERSLFPQELKRDRLYLRRR